MLCAACGPTTGKTNLFDDHMQSQVTMTILFVQCMEYLGSGVYRERAGHATFSSQQLTCLHLTQCIGSSYVWGWLSHVSIEPKNKINGSTVNSEIWIMFIS